MISRKSVLTLADLVTRVFYTYNRNSTLYRYSIDADKLYDFLFVNDYPAWFCNYAQVIQNSADSRSKATRPLKQFIMKLHTGETVSGATPDWSWEERMKLGQEYLRKLSEDLLNIASDEWDETGRLISNLELDGYELNNGNLLVPESDVLDVEEETTVLQALYSSLGLLNEETAFYHLSLSEEHYHEGRWEDSIVNSRKFVEAVCQEAADTHSRNFSNNQLDETIRKWPARVRDYLEEQGLIDKNEKEMIGKVYGVLSEKGGHPYMAKKDQARLLRHLALTISQFVMIRLRGALASISADDSA